MDYLLTTVKYQYQLRGLPNSAGYPYNVQSSVIIYCNSVIKCIGDKIGRQQSKFSSLYLQLVESILISQEQGKQ
jgi:hypothetical protein